MHVLVVADVFKVLGDSLGDAYLADRHLQGLHQFHCVVVGTVGGAEARHRDADDTLTVEAQLVEGLHRHEQCQCRVEAAADANDRLLGVDVIEALGESCHLDVQDLLTAVGHILRLRDKRMRVDLACQLKLFWRHGLAYRLLGVSVALGVDKRGVGTPLGAQHLHVDLAHLQLRLQ